MTLGGLALAVGILVDDATVTIENINFNLEQGKDVEPAILDGAHQIALPALVSTLSICIVFVPMFQLAGIAKYLFIPLAEAVVFAMLASYLLSRTLIPTLAKFWLKRKDEDHNRRKSAPARFQEALRAALRALSRGVQEAARARGRWRRTLCAGVPARDGRGGVAGISGGSLSRIGPGLLPDGRRRTAEIALAGEHRNAYRGDRHPVRSSGDERCAKPSRRASSPPSSTIWGCPTAASISLTAPPRRSDRAMPISSSTSPRSTPRSTTISANCARNWRLPTPRRNSRSCPPTSSVKS